MRPGRSPRRAVAPRAPYLIEIESSTTHYRVIEGRFYRDVHARFSDGSLRMIAVVDGPDL